MDRLDNPFEAMERESDATFLPRAAEVVRSSLGTSRFLMVVFFFARSLLARGHHDRARKWIRAASVLKPDSAPILSLAALVEAEVSRF